MGMTSTAEASLNAVVRPQIAAVRARTSYPRRPVTWAEARTAAPGRPGPLRWPPPPGAGRSARAGRRARPATVRLTRRGRLVLGALAAAAAVTAAALWLALGGPARASGSGVTGSGARGGGSMARVVVRPGDSLWGIAGRVDPSADPRVITAEIVADNGLAGTAIRAGQVLWVPRS